MNPPTTNNRSKKINKEISTTINIMSDKVADKDVVTTSIFRWYHSFFQISLSAFNHAKFQYKATNRWHGNNIIDRFVYLNPFFPAPHHLRFDSNTNYFLTKSLLANCSINSVDEGKREPENKILNSYLPDKREQRYYLAGIAKHRLFMRVKLFWQRSRV